MRVQWPSKVTNAAEPWAAKREVFHVHFAHDGGSGVEQPCDQRRVKVWGIAVHEMTAERERAHQPH